MRCFAVDLSDLFPASEYEFRMGIRRGEPAEFFRKSREHARVLAERRHWLATDPHAYSGLLPGGEPLLNEAIPLFEECQGITGDERKMLLEEPDPAKRLQMLGARLEPDVLLLAPRENGPMELLAGCVCFSSSWELSEKLGKSMAIIHEPAPGLTGTLGNQIEVFLSRLRPGVAWLRSNWGLSASAELNQHPARLLPWLSPEMGLDRVWLRVERQALVALPSSGGVLFGIRIESEPLDLLKERAPESADRLAHALQTMPEEIARYKGLASARELLITQLRS